jgi:hypothetical protein
MSSSCGALFADSKLDSPRHSAGGDAFSAPPTGAALSLFGALSAGAAGACVGWGVTTGRVAAEPTASMRTSLEEKGVTRIIECRLIEVAVMKIKRVPYCCRCPLTS